MSDGTIWEGCGDSGQRLLFRRWGKWWGKSSNPSTGHFSCSGTWNYWHKSNPPCWDQCNVAVTFFSQGPSSIFRPFPSSIGSPYLFTSCPCAILKWCSNGMCSWSPVCPSLWSPFDPSYTRLVIGWSTCQWRHSCSPICQVLTINKSSVCIQQFCICCFHYVFVVHPHRLSMSQHALLNRSLNFECDVMWRDIAGGKTSLTRKWMPKLWWKTRKTRKNMYI